jgi:integration host factor subunit alpha
VTTAELSARWCDRDGFATHEASAVVESIVAVLTGRLARGAKVKLSGFGTFKVRSKGPRLGRNPQTGAALTTSGIGEQRNN